MTTTSVPTSTSSASTGMGIGGNVQEYLWTWEGQQLPIPYETLGEGSPVLLLPAFSTVSTRAEMRSLAERLAPEFQVTVPDWPGFGQSPRPPLDYRPALYHQFLQDFIRAIFQTPIAVVAAGHAAGYTMRLVQQQPQAFAKVVLVAPTWRGPLNAMGSPQSLNNLVKQLVRSPLVGQALYKLNTTPSFLSLMYRRHVYSDGDHVTPELVNQRWQVTQQPGARFAPAAFVTGTLDPAMSQADFLAWFQPLAIPLRVIIGEQTPPKSLAEMEAIASLPGVETQRLPGSLGLHEEHAEVLAASILPFLKQG